jgi:hypothetical protein
MHLEDLGRRRKLNIEIEIRGKCCENVKWIGMAQHRVHTGASVNTAMSNSVS